MAIIGVSGYICSGKNLVCKIIQALSSKEDDWFKKETKKAILEWSGNWDNISSWKQKAFAGKLKEIASLMTGIPIENFEDQEFKKSYLGEEWSKYVPNFVNDGDGRMRVRDFLQILATEAIRNNLHTNAWVNALFSDIDRKLTSEEEKRLLSIWKNINTRSTNSNYEKYHLYGGKGIINEWDSFESFRDWSKNSGYTNDLTIDRKDSSKNYCPENCRWVTPSLQAFNQNVYKNSKTKIRGVSKKSDRDLWVAQIQFKNNKEHIGYFKTQQEAEVAYKKRYDEIEKILWKESLDAQYKSPNIIITDCRFLNEAQAIKDRGGIVVRVNRENPVPLISSHFHPSETALNSYNFDYIINNNGTIDELIEKVKIMLEYFKL